MSFGSKKLTKKEWRLFLMFYITIDVNISNGVEWRSKDAGKKLAESQDNERILKFFKFLISQKKPVSCFAKVLRNTHRVFFVFSFAVVRKLPSIGKIRVIGAMRFEKVFLFPLQ